jgi:hypothetical protein
VKRKQPGLAISIQVRERFRFRTSNLKDTCKSYAWILRTDPGTVSFASDIFMYLRPALSELTASIKNQHLRKSKFQVTRTTISDVSQEAPFRKNSESFNASHPACRESAEFVLE